MSELGLRICFIADARYIHTYRWVRYFSSRGYESHVVSFVPTTAADRAQIAACGASFHGDLDGFHLKRWWRTLRSLNLLRSVIKKQRIQVLHCHFLGANAWYAALTQFHPLVLTVTGGDVVGPDWSPNGSRRSSFLTPYALRHSDLVTCWSSALARAVRGYCRPSASVEVIHGGVDLEQFTPGAKPMHLLRRWDIPETAKVIFSPRLMRPLYNIHRIAEAAVKLSIDEPNTMFVFAAARETQDPDYEAFVRSILAGTVAEDRVRFVGAIPHAEMPDYYRLADVTVSVPASDGTPMSILESMACGTPVVAAAISDYDPGYIEDGCTALLAMPSDPASISAAILRFLRDEEFAEAVIARARSRVLSTASYSAQMGRMDELYQQLLAS